MRDITLKLPTPDDQPQGRPVPWFEGDIETQDFPWVALDESYQWTQFRRAIKTLQRRGNRVFVLVGPMNTHLMTEASAQTYDGLRAEIASWLEASAIPHYAPAALPSALYADSSHPLEHGYAQLAEQLYEQEAFRDWLGRVRRP